MKTNYFTKVENKYVFNVSLIFWHLFIALSSLAIMISLAIFLWSIIPPFESKVRKQPYPEKQQYPAPVVVSLADLRLEDVKDVETLPIPEETPKLKPKPEVKTVYQDTTGKSEYEKALEQLKELIPPTKYSWAGAGFWTYPYGERYWQVYKQERYRKWNVSKTSVEDRLQSAFKKTKADNFYDKKQVLSGFISVVKPLQESKRMNIFQSLIDNVSSNLDQTVNTSVSISKVVQKIPEEEDLKYINKLNLFGKNNPRDGSPFIDYVSNIIDKFNPKQHNNIIESLINSYYNFFDQNISKQIEATDFFIPFLAQIDEEKHLRGLMQYYRVYLDKNYTRNRTVDHIENDYKQKVDAIESNYEISVANARMKYQQKKVEKQNLRSQSLLGIGAGILVIVLIAVVLVFLSIQRSVSKIEEKISQKATI